MSNIVKRKNANGSYAYLIQYYIDGKRKSIRFSSHYQRREIEVFKDLIDEITDAEQLGRVLSNKQQALLNTLPREVKKKFGHLGLLEGFESITTAEMWNRYYDEMDRVRQMKNMTLLNIHTVMRRFLEYFDPNGNPNRIRDNDALLWFNELRSKYAEATVTAYIQRSKAIFNWAVKNHYCDKNPFRGIKKGSYVNKDREFFIPLRWYEKLLEAAPDQTWRTLISLCRIGGLRNPSETLALRWEDVNWSENKLLVRSCKTERIMKKGTRVIPMFYSLRRELEKQFEQAEEGSFYVIEKWRSDAQNLRKRFERIVFLAGLPRWERLFHNLRGSRSNELFSQYPSHVAGYWMGQSTKVAMDHYLHPTDEQYAKASAQTESDQTASEPWREEIIN